MGCFQSTPEGPTPAQLAAIAEEKRKAEAKAAEDRRIEAERREKEEKEIAARVAAALEQKRIEAEQLAAQREREAKAAADLEKHREMKWKEEMEAREKAVADKERALAAQSPRNKKKGGKGAGAGFGYMQSAPSPRHAARSNANNSNNSGDAASPKNPNGTERPSAENGYGFNITVPDDESKEKDEKKMMQTPFISVSRPSTPGFGSISIAQPGVMPHRGGGGGGGDGGAGGDSDQDDTYEYRPDIDRKQQGALNNKEDPDLRSIRIALTDTFVFWGQTKGKTDNLLVNPIAQKEANVGWKIEDGEWALHTLAKGEAPNDYATAKNCFLGTDRATRSQTIDLVRAGIAPETLELCPRIEIHSYVRSPSIPKSQAVKWKVIVSVLDHDGKIIDQFIAKKTAKHDMWTEIFHTFKRNENYNRRPRYVLFKEYGRKKVLKNPELAAAAAAEAAQSGAHAEPVQYYVMGSSVQLHI